MQQRAGGGHSGAQFGGHVQHNDSQRLRLQKTEKTGVVCQPCFCGLEQSRALKEEHQDIDWNGDVKQAGQAAAEAFQCGVQSFAPEGRRERRTGSGRMTTGVGCCSPCRRQRRKQQPAQSHGEQGTRHGSQQGQPRVDDGRQTQHRPGKKKDGRRMRQP